MGTSSSFRSPLTPRWNVFNRALDNQMPLERLRASLFLAGEAEWREALGAPALGAFADALLRAHGSLAERFAMADQPAAVVATIVSEARAASFEEAYSPALPVAERALRAVLIKAAQDPVPLADAEGPQAAAAWMQNRGDPLDLLRSYVGEVFGQWSAHVLSRDAARLCGPNSEISGAEIRRLGQDLATEVAELAISVPITAPSQGSESYWQKVVEATFVRGRRVERQT